MNIRAGVEGGSRWWDNHKKEWGGWENYLNLDFGCGYSTLMAQTVKNMPVMQKIQVWFLGWEDTLEKEMATHNQNSCLENPMDRGGWWATVHGVEKSWTWLKQLSMRVSRVCSSFIPVDWKGGPYSKYFRFLQTIWFCTSLLQICNSAVRTRKQP